MKYLRTLLITILLLVLLILGVISACVINPGLSDKIGKFLFPNKSDSIVVETTIDPDINTPVGNDAPTLDNGTSIETNEVPSLPEDIYISPDEADIVIPDDVRGANGYEEPVVSTTELGDDEAGRLSKSLGFGNTGDDLSFDSLFYPFYHMLDENQKKLYRQIYANANDLTKEFAPVINCTTSELKPIFEAVFNDHPELFWLNTAYSLSSKRNGDVAAISLSFNQTANDINTSKSIFNSAAESILSSARTLGSDFEKEKFVHDALSDRISYNKSAPMNQSAYSALVNGSTVCAGYARAFQYLMQQLNIPTYYCTGKAGENHAWNIIKLDNDFYNVDVTWDDTGKNRYEYFNKPDSYYASTHIRKNLSVNLPPCNGSDYQIYEENESDSELDDIVDDSVVDTYVEDPYKDINVCYNLIDYYNDCYSKILNTGLGDYRFDNILYGYNLFTEWDRSYQTGEYKSAYLEDAMKKIGATGVQLRLHVEQIDENRYLITHEIMIR